jgi:hypothetical protein
MSTIQQNSFIIEKRFQFIVSTYYPFSHQNSFIMEKTGYAIAFFLLLTRQAFSQAGSTPEADFKLGAVVAGTSQKLYNFTKEGSNVMVFKDGGIEERWNSNELTIETQQKDSTHGDDCAMIAVKERTLVFSVGYNSLGAKTLYVRSLQVANGTSGPAQALLELDGLQGDVRIYTSYNQSKIGVSYFKTSKKGNLLSLHVFDDQLQLQWNKEIASSVDIGVEYSVDDSGKTSWLNKVIDGDASPEQSIVYYQLVQVSGSGLSANVQTLKLNPVKYVTDEISLVNLPDNRIAIATLYADERAVYTRTGGVVYITVSAEGTIEVQKQFPISRELSNGHQTSYDRRQHDQYDALHGHSFMSNLHLTKVVVETDGSVLVIAEQSYSIKGDHNVTHTSHKDILLTKITAGGELAWMQKVSKNQRGFLAVSYAVMKSENEYYILYADRSKNLMHPLQNSPWDFSYIGLNMGLKKNCIVAEQFNKSTGQHSKKMLFQLKEATGTNIAKLEMTDVVPVGNRTFIVEWHTSGNSRQLLKVTMK